MRAAQELCKTWALLQEAQLAPLGPNGKDTPSRGWQKEVALKQAGGGKNTPQAPQFCPRPPLIPQGSRSKGSTSGAPLIRPPPSLA